MTWQALIKSMMWLVVLGGGTLACDSGKRSDSFGNTAGMASTAGTSNAAGGGGGSVTAGAGPSGGSSAGGGAGGATAASGANGGVAGSTAPGDSLAAKYADFFPIGAAIGYYQLTELPAVLAQDFNHLTCENAMKIQDIHPAEDTWAWDDADSIANFAREHQMKLTGHTLLWHQQAPEWMFAGVTAGDAASLELLKSRLKAHIEAVVERYADVVDNWDVVNEALSDDPAKQYRDGSEGSKWFELFGSEEYIYWAYKFAKDALEAKLPGSSAGKLYYNEYTATTKLPKILKLLAWLKDEKGLGIDGVGFQSHETMTWPSTADLQKSFDQLEAAGYKVKISELDITVYSDYSSGKFVASPAATFTSALEAQQAKRFGDLFALYRANKGQLTSVTFWGVSDDQTWLDNAPVAGRDDFPLLYNDQHQPKAARAAIMSF